MVGKTADSVSRHELGRTQPAEPCFAPSQLCLFTVWRSDGARVNARGRGGTDPAMVQAEPVPSSLGLPTTVLRKTLVPVQPAADVRGG